MSATLRAPLELLRAELLALEPYRPATWAPGFTRLHANENPWRIEADPSSGGMNRYPEPYPRALEAALAALYGVAPAALIAARGSDECIDLVVRAACTAQRDAVLICPPTFAMYATAARIQGAGVLEVPLKGAGFALDLPAIERACVAAVKLVFVCSPNNPTGGASALSDLDLLARRLAHRALLVVDEAYAEFSGLPSATTLLAEHANLIVLRTLSKAHALAGARIGVALAHPALIEVLRRLVPPYAIAVPCLEAAQAALAPGPLALARARIAALIAERERVGAALTRLPGIEAVLPSDANFLLLRSADAPGLLAAAREARFLLRDVSAQPGLAGCVRISIGSPEQNDALLGALWRRLAA